MQIKAVLLPSDSAEQGLGGKDDDSPSPSITLSFASNVGSDLLGLFLFLC